MLKRLISKKEITIIGLNSGTSADGVDCAMIHFLMRKSRPQVTFIAGETIPYRQKMRLELERLISTSELDSETISRFDIAFGVYLGGIAKEFMRRTGHKADLIASHGQTIGHYPKKKSFFGAKLSSTLQIGDGNAIALQAGIPAVSDFRKADVAGGGEGAPLTPFVNQLLFGDKRKSRIIVNIGGIANYSFHPAGSDYTGVMGKDCGPGNTLIDNAMRLLFHKSYDKDGAVAYKGQVIKELVDEIKRANRRKSVSTGREQFDRLLIARLVYLCRRAKGSTADIIASVTEATVELIYSSIKRYLSDAKLEGIFLAGGGRRNMYLVEQLQKRSRSVNVWPIEALGFDGDLLEAVSFAVLGGCYLLGMPSTLPNLSGSMPGGVAGKLSLPAQKDAKKK